MNDLLKELSTTVAAVETRTVMVEPQTLERLTYGVWTPRAFYRNALLAAGALSASTPILRTTKDLVAFEEGRVVALDTRRTLAIQTVRLKKDPMGPAVDAAYLTTRQNYEWNE